MDRTWFDEPAFNDLIFHSANQFLKDKEAWALSLTDIADESSDPENVKVCAVERYEYTKQDLEMQVVAVRNGRTSTLDAFEAIQEASQKRSIWQLDRQSSSSKKASAVLQKSMTDFSSFLENFAGIVTIAQAADQQYGGLAYGTLSLLLSTFVHKTQREQALDDGFEELGLAFPRLVTLQALDKSSTDESSRSFNRLEAQIAATFGLVLSFAREATKYYESRSRRLRQTLQPDQYKNRTLAEIRKKLNEIRNEVEILQLAKIHSLEHKMDALRLKLNETHDGVMSTQWQLARARSSSDISHLAELRQILNIEERSPHTELAAYKRLLTDAFASKFVRDKYQRPKTISIQLLKADDEFRKWWESGSSCLLFAGGSNMLKESSSSSLNWLSLGAVLAVEELRNQNKKVAFFLAQTTWTVKSRRRRCPTRKIMASLLYQIAQMHGDLLRSEVDKLKAAVRSAAWKDDAVDQFMEEMHDLLVQTLSCFPVDEKIHIVIDRLDQCAWKEDEEDQWYAEMRLAVEWLLCVAAEAPCQLKILLTVDAASSKRLEKSKSALSKKERRALLLKADWCQETEPGRTSSLVPVSE